MAPYKPKDPVVWRVMRRWRGPLGCLAGLLIMITTVPLVPFFLVRRWVRNAYFHRTLKQQGRMISWRDFLDRAGRDPGSVIIEVGNKRRTRFWWSDDRILSRAPMKPLEFSELDIIAYGGADQHPFIEWCYQNYLSLEDGHAIYVEDCAEADFETFPFDPDYERQMKERFPRQDVVVVTFFDVRYA